MGASPDETSDHYAEAAFSEPGRCWRMIANPDGTGHPKHCPEPVVRVGNHLLAGGKRIRVWSCDGHREGLEQAERVDHR
jgi:hypothetical protein